MRCSILIELSPQKLAALSETPCFVPVPHSGFSQKHQMRIKSYESEL